MEKVTNLILKVTNLILKVDKSDGGRFLSIKGYTNSKGEVSNVLINAKVSYEKAKDRDLNKLAATNILHLPKCEHSVENLAKAKTALMQSLIKPNQNRSKGQTDAYISLGNGIRIHRESAKVSIWGLVVNKTVLVEGEPRKPVNSSALTKAKNYLKKELNLSTGKFRMYHLGQMEAVRLNGQVLQMA